MIWLVALFLCLVVFGRITVEAKSHRSHVRHHRVHRHRTHAKSPRVRELRGRVTYHFPRRSLTAYGRNRHMARIAAVNRTDLFPKGSTVQLLMPNKHGKMVVVAQRKVADKMGPRFRAISKPCVDFYVVGPVPKHLRQASNKMCRLRVILPT